MSPVGGFVSSKPSSQLTALAYSSQGVTSLKLKAPRGTPPLFVKLYSSCDSIKLRAPSSKPQGWRGAGEGPGPRSTPPEENGLACGTPKPPQGLCVFSRLRPERERKKREARCACYNGACARGEGGVRSERRRKKRPAVSAGMVPVPINYPPPSLKADRGAPLCEVKSSSSWVVS